MKSKANATYLFPGAVGALPRLHHPVDALEGQDHFSSACRVKHKVSRWDVDVQELSRAARFLHLQDVQEHIETCQRPKHGQQLGGLPPAPGAGCDGEQLSHTWAERATLCIKSGFLSPFTADLLCDFEKVTLGCSPDVLNAIPQEQGSRCPWPDLVSKVGSFRDQGGETQPADVQRSPATLHLATVSLSSSLPVAFKPKGCFRC